MKLINKDYWKSLINMAVIKFLVLRTLKTNPSHGYGILNQVKEFTQGCCTPTYGSVYPILKELCEEGYAEVKFETVNNRERKVYYLTEQGEQAYLQAKEAWQDILPFLNKVMSEEVDGDGDN
ncbi:PadR family transcriptional regulator [Natranaerobius thermophilus]|uniref:Transcriptional regulator, PadR-like family n=1 Tax=Natranaerobius thermophilus (strain ATCC BAA-1301 / DSM 18059 / JW/NM-WN-LF) TaxID=457570 RepID=B2A0I7_NATTJ|nr:PadR family transcriptional regulator [Natranaerobius thermophilus]ACB84548.1 transcriptional regulator, PadR-like family [Natranaerobius thermophilus JW/NM-WN-LF]